MNTVTTGRQIASGADSNLPTVIVTGAAQGIGECVARTLNAQGHRLFLADIQTEKVEQVAASLDAGATYVDISNPDSTDDMVDSALKQLGHIDALVNVAGIDAPYARSEAVDREQWRRLIDTDLSGPWWCIQSALPHFLQRGGGRIVLISSICGVLPTSGISVAYSAAKAGVIGMTMSLAEDLERRGILVNAIAPGVIGTTGTPMPQLDLDAYRAKFPLGEGGPQPVADAVSYLLSDSGRWISGAVLNVTGGYWRGR